VVAQQAAESPCGCHPEEPQATKDLCSCLILQTAEILRSAQNDRLQGFYRSLSSSNYPWPLLKQRGESAHFHAKW
jgi:hypothetical protein